MPSIAGKNTGFEKGGNISNKRPETKILYVTFSAKYNI